MSSNKSNSNNQHSNSNSSSCSSTSEETKAEIIYFYGHHKNAKYGLFSQFYPCHFVKDNISYCCAEQWMMSGKARTFHDNETLESILSNSDPKTIKRLGRKVGKPATAHNFNGQQWDAVKYNIVLEGNRLKFNQNERLKKTLISTGSSQLVEAAGNDRVWGIGISVEEAKNGKKWNGENLLGKALMEVRQEIFDFKTAKDKVENIRRKKIETANRLNKEMQHEKKQKAMQLKLDKIEAAKRKKKQEEEAKLAKKNDPTLMENNELGKKIKKLKKKLKQIEKLKKKDQNTLIDAQRIKLSTEIELLVEVGMLEEILQSRCSEK